MRNNSVRNVLIYIDIYYLTSLPTQEKYLLTWHFLIHKKKISLHGIFLFTKDPHVFHRHVNNSRALQEVVQASNIK